MIVEEVETKATTAMTHIAIQEHLDGKTADSDGKCRTTNKVQSISFNFIINYNMSSQSLPYL